MYESQKLSYITLLCKDKNNNEKEKINRFTPELAGYCFFPHSCHVTRYKQRSAVIMCNVM